MELVYLWVEEYKNIIGQGFNFSPRFECSYDEKKEELTINENKDYVSIFPKNINVTAIVGENGSGKSNLLEILSNYISDDKLTIKVFYDGAKFLYKTNNLIEINTTFTKQDVSELTVLYTEIPSNNSIDNQNITNISLWKQLQENDYGIFENFNLIKNKMQTSHMILIKKYDFLPGINKKPQYIEFSFNHYYFDNIKHDDIDLIFISILKILIDRDYYKYKEGNDIDEYLSYDYENLSKNDVEKFIKKYITDQDTLDWLKSLIDLTNQFMKNYFQILHSEVKYGKQMIPKKNKENDFDDEEDEENEIRTFRISIKFEDFSEDFLNSIENLFSYSREELIINLKWDITLSTGEESFLNLFASLYNCIKKYSYSLEHINIIVDEIEAYLHPNWQKQFIDLIIKFFNLKGIKYNSKTNIILTSHSPFILSDLPKENVIFLKNGKQEYPFKNNEQTFGANIHTLLSHGFFMEYGLLGEFAKNKINEIKKFYDFIQKFKSKINAKEKIKERVKKYYLNKKERFNHIQSIIGEPFLQTIIGNYLDEFEQIFDMENYKSNKKQKLLEQFSEKELEEFLESKKNAKA